MASLHQTPTRDTIYCEHCGFEEERELAKSRPLKVLDGPPPPVAWRLDKMKDEGRIQKKKERGRR